MVLEIHTTAQCLVHEAHSVSRTDLRQGSITVLSVIAGIEILIGELAKSIIIPCCCKKLIPKIADVMSVFTTIKE